MVLEPLVESARPNAVINWLDREGGEYLAGRVDQVHIVDSEAVPDVRMYDFRARWYAYGHVRRGAGDEQPLSSKRTLKIQISEYRL